MSKKKAKDTFIARDDWAPIFQCLPAEAAKKLIVAILTSHKDGTIEITPESDPMLYPIYSMMMGQISATDKRWEEEVEARRRAGAAGGMAKAENRRKAEAAADDEDDVIRLTGDYERDMEIMNAPFSKKAI